MAVGIFVKDFMTEDVISVAPSTPVWDVIKTIFLKGFSGIPVVGDDGILVGLITDYDFIAKGSLIYFSPMGNELQKLKAQEASEPELEKMMRSVITSEAKDIMNSEPMVFDPLDTVVHASNLFLKHHRVNPVPVVDEKKKLIGIVSRRDLIKLYSEPSFWKKYWETS